MVAAAACVRLAGALSGEEDLINQSERPTASLRAVRWLQLERIAPNPALDWRIRGRGLVAGEFDLIMDSSFIARLWSSFRSALHEFKISTQRRCDHYSRFRDAEIRKCDRRRYGSSGSRPRLSTRSNQLMGSVRQRSVAAVSYANATTNSNAGCELISGDESSGSEREQESVANETTPFMKWKRPRWQMELEDFSPRPNRIQVAALSSSKSMDELNSIRWDPNVLTHSASTRAPHELRETTSASTSYLDRCRWKYRVSHTSPRLVQPVRGKLTTLASLLRTMSDRYARRTGKLRGSVTPLQDTSKQRRPMLTQSLSAPPQHDKVVDDLAMKRYDNPFRDFLRQSFAERNLTFLYGIENDRQR